MNLHNLCLLQRETGVTVGMYVKIGVSLHDLKSVITSFRIIDTRNFMYTIMISCNFGILDETYNNKYP